MAKKIELLAPAGSMANLKAAVSRGADAVYLGMQRFNARSFATNFTGRYLKEAVKLSKSNNTKVFLTMNTLIRNDEMRDFFSQLDFAYSCGIDAVIIQEISLIGIIRKRYPGLRVHVSTQAGVMNSSHASLLENAHRINLARELTKEEICEIRKKCSQELEVFCHGALCACVSGSCLFSSFLGGRSGNRGKCAQPCRKLYNSCYFLSLKDLCLIDSIPEIIDIGINSLKIEGRMRSPSYVAAVTEVYRKAIDSYYEGSFCVTDKMRKKLEAAFSRGFTSGWFNHSGDMFNRKDSGGRSILESKEEYNVTAGKFECARKKPLMMLPGIKGALQGEKSLGARVYNAEDGIKACKAGADIVYFDIFNGSFEELKQKISCRLFGATPRIMLDSDKQAIMERINAVKPDGILAGNPGVLGFGLKVPVHTDYNFNVFNDYDIEWVQQHNAVPIISPELSMRPLKQLASRNFITLVHGKLRLMTLRHELGNITLEDEKGGKFVVDGIRHGSEIINAKELGLLGKSSQLVDSGIGHFYVDTENDVSNIVSLYRKVLDSIKVEDAKLKKNYVLGWAYRGVY